MKHTARVTAQGHEQQCQYCERWKPATEDYFRKRAHTFILQNYCHDCYNQKRLADALKREAHFSRTGIVYFVYIPAFSKHRPEIKLGFTSNLHVRMGDYVRDFKEIDINPHLIGIMDGDMYLETAIMNKFKHLRHSSARRERLRVMPDLLDYIETNTTLSGEFNIETMSVADLREALAD